MKNKNVLVSGATGGIGGAITWLLLEQGYRVYAPVRSRSKAEEKFANYPNRDNLIIEVCNIEDVVETRRYIKTLRSKGVFFYSLILAAGTLLYDHSFVTVPKMDDKAEEDKLKKEIFMKLSPAERFPIIEESKKANYIANTVTKENIILPYLEFYAVKIGETFLEMIGSQAAGFPEGHKWRFDEEGYHFSHVGVRDVGKEYGYKFHRHHVAEPELIDTPMTRIKFALNDDGTPRDWTKVMKDHEYALTFLTERGYI